MSARGFDTLEDEEDSADRAAGNRAARLEAAIDAIDTDRADVLARCRKSFKEVPFDSRYDGPWNYVPGGGR